MNLLVTGCYGQLGTELRKIAATDTVHTWFFTDIDTLDICDETSVNTFFERHQIEICVNCAAYTAVDQAEDDAEMAEKVNVQAPRILANACQRQGATLLHISTDYVFDGQGDHPYREDEPTAPVSVYGRTKRDGERAIIDSGCHFLIVRTAWLYSSTGKNFVKTMLRLADTHDTVSVVCDQTGTPTWAGDLAQALVRLIEKYGKSPVAEVFHFTNEGVTNWADFAATIFDLAGKPCKVLPITTDQYPTKATRPAYSVLDKTKIKQALGMDIPFWRDSLSKCLEEFTIIQ